MVRAQMAAKPSAAAELGSRVKAARHYRGLDQKKAAKKMRVEPATLGRYEKGEIPELKRRGLIDRTAKAMRLPEEFFVIDFNDLPAMVQQWRQVGSPQWSLELDRELAAAELESELEREAQRVESTGTHSATSEPESESQ